MHVYVLAAAFVASMMGAASPQTSSTPSELIGVEPPAFAPMPPAPAFRPGMVVSDRTGGRLGVVESFAETLGGPNVVINMDGKLIGVAPETLKLAKGGVVSSQTKREILLHARAPD